MQKFQNLISVFQTRLLTVNIALLFFPAVFFQTTANGQTPNSKSIPAPPIAIQTLVKIVRAEDELRFDTDLQSLLGDKNAKIRTRAALAAGRIGNENALPFLVNLLEKDEAAEVQTMAVFAIGEIESIKGADAVIKVLADTKNNGELRARAIEAAGKIAANAKDAKAKDLGEAILDALEFEDKRRSMPNIPAILQGLTAVLRARPAEGEFVAAKFLTYTSVTIRQNATNTLGRLRAKNANEQLRAMLLADDDAVVRANAARVLGIAEDQTALDLLITAATEDEDQRVRVAAIRALANLKDKKAVEPLLASAEKLFASYKSAKMKVANPSEKNELLEIVTTLGKLLANSNNLQSETKGKIVMLPLEFWGLENFKSSEIDIALVRIAPYAYFARIPSPVKVSQNWQETSVIAQGFGEMPNIKSTSEREIISMGSSFSEIPPIRGKALSFLESFVKKPEQNLIRTDSISQAIPDVLRAYAQFKPADLAEVLREHLKHKDIQIRTTSAELLGELPPSKENVEALKTAFAESLKNDKNSNDATLAILSALVKLDKPQSFESLKLALDAPDFLVRRHAAQLIKQNDLTKDLPNAAEKVGTVKPHNPKNAAKLGVILNTNADYVRAVSRKNGQTKALLTTEKGAFTIDLMPEDTPLNVDNFIKLAKSGYFNGIAFHRVVPNFVVQGGDPRGDGNGGPGWQIRCEINMLNFERGAVGMALSGKDTGGSQWFVTHSPQPHLDGGYTVFGKVNDAGMKIVDSIARGDKILSVKIIEGNAPVKTRKGK